MIMRATGLPALHVHRVHFEYRPDQPSSARARHGNALTGDYFSRAIARLSELEPSSDLKAT